MENTQNTPHPHPIGHQNDQEDKAEYLKNYIDYLSQEQPALGNFAVCPFAKNSKYKIIECSAADIEIDDYDVILYVVEDNLYLEDINRWVDYYNSKYEDWLFFEDHSTYHTFISGLQTNNGKYNLIIGQPKEKLLKFRESLKKTDYYSYWDEDYYNKIVG